MKDHLEDLGVDGKIILKQIFLTSKPEGLWLMEISIKLR
jgi:hypothetical protein